MATTASQEPPSKPQEPTGSPSDTTPALTLTREDLEPLAAFLGQRLGMTTNVAQTTPVA